MAMISLRQLLDHAAEHGYGVPAFNVNNLEQIQAIMQAAQKTDSPVILQASAGARKYAGEPYLRHLVLAATWEDEVVRQRVLEVSDEVCAVGNVSIRRLADPTRSIRCFHGGAVSAGGGDHSSAPVP